MDIIIKFMFIFDDYFLDKNYMKYSELIEFIIKLHTKITYKLCKNYIKIKN